ncbi:MAG: PorP/SprF family type IX secretion system membrane protein [Saprospiraceae bacterium]|nr:PorP/SprF family type IX secretion system membrane protein [Saprospiraceae bacterium]
MNLFSKLTFFVLVCTAIIYPNQEAEAQDPRFSQYYAAPMRINPAMVGVMDGSWRVGVNYRTQWSAVLGKAYKTFGAMGDVRIPVFKDDFVGVGIGAMTDVSGVGNYNTTDVNLGFSYRKKLSQKSRYIRNSSVSYLVAGAQIGFGQRAIKWDNLTYSTQWVGETGTYNTQIYSGENPNVRTSRMYFDASAGLMWYGTFGRRRSVYAGAGVYHLNRPDISLFNRPAKDSLGNSLGSGVENLYMRWVLQAGGEVLVGGRNSSISLLPGVVTMFQGPSTEINAGLGVRYKAPKYDDFAFRLSVWTRLANDFSGSIGSDALIFIVGLDYLNFQFGISYDVNISALRAASSGRGAMEFSLIYTNPGDAKRRDGCPSFNF